MTVTGPYYTHQKNLLEKIWNFDQKTNNELAYMCGQVHKVDDDDSGMWIDIYVEFKDWQNMHALDNYFPEEEYEITCATKRPEVEAAATTQQAELGKWKQFGARLDMA